MRETEQEREFSGKSTRAITRDYLQWARYAVESLSCGHQWYLLPTSADSDS